MTDAPVWAVITTYFPDGGLLASLASLSDQVAGTIVVDDGTGPEASDVLHEVEASGAIVIRRAVNSGIAAALNAGIVAALDRGAQSVLTLDQDSTVPAGFVDALRAENERRPIGERGPVVPEYFADVRQGRGRRAGGALGAAGIIQSGMLLDGELIETVGLMREEFFIDLVDTEFELRCRLAGRMPTAARGLRLPHRLGERYRRHGPAIPGLPRTMTLSSPFRYYYRARNRLLLERLYLRRFPGRLVRDGIVERVYFVVAWGIARPRRRMWTILRAGVRDGRRGIGGRASEIIATVAASVRWHADRVD